MIAFTIAPDGRVVPSSYLGHTYLRPIEDPRPLLQLATYTRRERRRAAREGRKGRRGARRVKRMRPLLYQPLRYIRMTAHHLTDGRKEVILYLPDGVDLSPRHCAAVELEIALGTSGL